MAAGLSGVVNYVKEHWGNAVPINCLLVTDGQQFCGEHYEGEFLASLEPMLPFSFTGTLSILCMNHVDNLTFVNRFKHVYSKIIQRSGLEGMHEETIININFLSGSIRYYYTLIDLKSVYFLF